jgi:hypothetical protein
MPIVGNRCPGRPFATPAAVFDSEGELQTERMMKRILAFSAVLGLAAATPVLAQTAGGISVEPHVGYGFFGTLPDGGPRIEPAVAYGGRVAYQFADQFAVFGTAQQANTTVDNKVDVGGIRLPAGTHDARVQHWSAGVEFSFVPRGGAERMLPILMEAGLGQARYRWAGETESDFAVNLGIGSALQLSRNFSIRYGANDYISNFAERGVANQIFVRVGGELTF